MDRAVDVLSAAVERLEHETDTVSEGPREALEFYRFWRDELPATMERWPQHRRALRGRQPSAAGA